MKSRARWFAALLALFAFSATLAEQAGASLCAIPGSAAPAGAGSAGAPHAMPGHHVPAAPGGDEQEQRSSPLSCPLAAISSSCTVVSLPAAPLRDWDAPVIDDGAVLVLTDRIPDLLIGSSLFRPPQA